MGGEPGQFEEPHSEFPMCGQETQRRGPRQRNGDFAVHVGALQGCAVRSGDNSMLNGINNSEISSMRRDKQTLCNFSLYFEKLFI